MNYYKPLTPVDENKIHLSKLDNNKEHKSIKIQSKERKNIRQIHMKKNKKMKTERNKNTINQ